MPRLTRLHLLLFAFTVLIATVGCTKSPVVPVSGTVSFANRDTPEVCKITFVPQGGGKGIRPSGTDMQADGTYSPVEHLGVNGLLPGTYVVRLNYFDLKKNGNPDRDGDWKETTFEAEQLVIEEGSGPVVHDIEVE